MMKKNTMRVPELPEEQLHRLEREKLSWEEDTAKQIRARLPQGKKPRWRLIRPLLLAAALTVVFGLSAVAVVRHWTLVPPETYEGPIDTVEREKRYGTGQPVPPEDEAWISQAKEILGRIGVGDYDREKITVRSGRNQDYDRPETTVTFPREEERLAEVTFHTETGQLLQVFTMTREDGSGDWDHEEKAAALAREYYQKLPVPQGYVLRDGGSRMDEYHWTFDFCREVAPGIYSSYECVRIGVNPSSGTFESLVLFSIPLLDDHEQGQLPLEEAKAREAAQAYLKEYRPGVEYQLRSAERAVVLPCYESLPGAVVTDEKGNPLSHRCDGVTRLAWRLRYENPDAEFADQMELSIDLYTGELLCVDETK